MLGVRYGEKSLVLPNWRIAGADNPFSIHVWPGFLSYASFPVFMVLTFSFLSLLFSASSILPLFHGQLWPTFADPSRFSLAIASLWIVVCVFVYRRSLNELHENWRLWGAIIVARLLRIELVPNTENAIYRMRLEIAEANRIGSSFSLVKKFAIAIEDQQFNEHSGINWKGVLRAVINRIRFKKKSGGSSITQQLARTVFIKRLSPVIRRKIVETLPAKWLESVFTKNSILEAYLTNARFERGIYGFHRAHRMFFLHQATDLSGTEAFFLIERLANIHGYILGDRILMLIRRLKEEGYLSDDDIVELLVIYESLKGSHLREKESQASLTDIAKHFSLEKRFLARIPNCDDSNAALDEIKANLN